MTNTTSLTDYDKVQADWDKAQAEWGKARADYIKAWEDYIKTQKDQKTRIDNIILNAGMASLVISLIIIWIVL